MLEYKIKKLEELEPIVVIIRAKIREHTTTHFVQSGSRKSQKYNETRNPLIYLIIEFNGETWKR